jgi:hypothetical protein
MTEQINGFLVFTLPPALDYLVRLVYCKGFTARSLAQILPVDIEPE